MSPGVFISLYFINVLHGYACGVCVVFACAHTRWVQMHVCGSKLASVIFDNFFFLETGSLYVPGACQFLLV